MSLHEVGVEHDQFGLPRGSARGAPRCRRGTARWGFAAAAAACGAVDGFDLDRLTAQARRPRAIDPVEDLLRAASVVGRLRRARVELEHLDVAVDRGALHEGDALALHGVGDDDLGPVGDGVELAEGRLDRGRVVAVDALHMPTEGAELRLEVAERGGAARRE